MEIQERSENVIFVDCSPKPAIDEELERLIIVIRGIRGKTANIVIDFSKTDVITASNISILLKLRKLLKDEGQRLILSGLNSRARSVFITAGLHQAFEFSNDKSAALAAISAA